MARSRRRLLAVVAVALLPFLAAWWLRARMSEAAARRVATELGVAGDGIAELAAGPVPSALPPEPNADAIAALDGEPAPFRNAAETNAERIAAPSSTASEALLPPVHVLVSRERVLAAADAGIRPSGTAVPATGWRPAGLALQGVSALGVGLRDGDVLVGGGVPATSVAALTGAVIAALRSHQSALSAELWRGRQRILVTVELPDLTKVDTRRAPRQNRGP